MDAFTVPSGQVPVTYGERPRRLRGLATALTVLLAAAGVVLLGAGLTMLFRSWLVYRAIDGRALSPVVAERVDALVTVLVVLQAIVTVATAVLFLVWQYRHATNARLLGHRGELGPEWAIGGWFIPVANYVLPAAQLYSTSRHADPRAAAAPDRRGHGQPIIPIWAVVFGVGNVLGLIGLLPTDGRGVTGDDSPARRVAAVNLFGGIGELILVAAAVLALIMVRRLSTLQERALGLASQPAAWAAPSAWPHPAPQPPVAWQQATPPAPTQAWPPPTAAGSSWSTPAGLPTESPVAQPPVAQPPAPEPPVTEPALHEPGPDGPPVAPPPPPPPS